MALKIGIIGLPNVGKSTTFNALTQTQQAQVANYPFCTIQPNRAIVPVPDSRVEKLASLLQIDRAVHATIEFVDIAGLVKGASKGEGLGNQFLGHIRDTDALAHVVRCFSDSNVVHLSGKIDPVEDIDVLNLELSLADLQQLERKIERLTRQVKGDKKLAPLLELALTIQAHLQTGQPLTRFEARENRLFQELDREMRFLTNKPLILVANVDESGLAGESPFVQAVHHVGQEFGNPVVVLCASLEQDIADLSGEERLEFLQLAGVTESGLEKVIHECYSALGLISYFTHNETEVRAWAIPKECPAPKAAGVIHSDFERGFICAEVVPFETYLRYGSDAAAKAAGAIRSEGKTYLIQDGDVVLYRFNL